MNIYVYGAANALLAVKTAMEGDKAIVERELPATVLAYTPSEAEVTIYEAEAGGPLCVGVGGVKNREETFSRLIERVPDAVFIITSYEWLNGNGTECRYWIARGGKIIAQDKAYRDAWSRAYRDEDNPPSAAEREAVQAFNISFFAALNRLSGELTSLWENEAARASVSEMLMQDDFDDERYHATYNAETGKWTLNDAGQDYIF
jgi:hypothetical protein